MINEGSTQTEMIGGVQNTTPPVSPSLPLRPARGFLHPNINFREKVILIDRDKE